MSSTNRTDCRYPNHTEYRRNTGYCKSTYRGAHHVISRTVLTSPRQQAYTSDQSAFQANGNPQRLVRPSAPIPRRQRRF